MWELFTIVLEYFFDILTDFKVEAFVCCEWERRPDLAFVPGRGCWRVETDNAATFNFRIIACSRAMRPQLGVASAQGIEFLKLWT
jgi:hypothetical protein